MLRLLRRNPGGKSGDGSDSDWREKNNQLILLINSRQADAAVALGQELLELVEKKYRRKDSREKATTHNNLGMAYMLAREYELAQECFLSALAMRKRLLGENHNEVALILLNLAQLFKMQAQEILALNKLEV